MKKLFALLVLLLLSCSSTKIVSSWCEPNKSISITDLNKVLVVALFKDETSQRKAEDQMVSYLNGKGVVSYTYFKSNFNLNILFFSCKMIFMLLITCINAKINYSN